MTEDRELRILLRVTYRGMLYGTYTKGWAMSALMGRAY